AATRAMRSAKPTRVLERLGRTAGARSRFVRSRSSTASNTSLAVWKAAAFGRIVVPACGAAARFGARRGRAAARRAPAAHGIVGRRAALGREDPLACARANEIRRRAGAGARGAPPAVLVLGTTAWIALLALYRRLKDRHRFLSTVAQAGSQQQGTHGTEQ